MDIPKTLSFLETYASEYIAAFYASLTSPQIHFAPAAASLPASTIIGGKSEPPSLALSPKLISFVAISLSIGIMLRAASWPSEDVNAISFPTRLVIVFVLWGAIGTLSHLFCIVLSGSGTYSQTLSITLQMYSALYVVAHAATFIWVSIGYSGTATAPQVYFSVQAVLLAIYTPLSLRRIHQFGGAQGLGRAAKVLFIVAMVILVGTSLWAKLRIFIESNMDNALHWTP